MHELRLTEARRELTERSTAAKGFPAGRRTLKPIFSQPTIQITRRLVNHEEVAAHMGKLGYQLRSPHCSSFGTAISEEAHSKCQVMGPLAGTDEGSVANIKNPLSQVASLPRTLPALAPTQPGADSSPH